MNLSREFAFSAVMVVVLSVLAPHQASSQTFQVGVSPDFIDLGEVDPGEVKTVRFNIVTPSEEPLTITLQAERVGLERVPSGSIEEFSEEDTSGWVAFLENPTTLSKDDRPIGSQAQNFGWRTVSFILQIPENAEPGWHMVKVNPIPTNTEGSIGGAGAKIVAISSVQVLFKVRGEAERKGEIIDVVQGNFAGTNLEVDTYFQNTGTVTISARGTQTFFRNGSTVAGDVKSAIEYVKPGERKILRTYLSDAATGEYKVGTVATYTTGSDQKNSTITVYEVPVIMMQQNEEFPWCIIIILIVAVIIISVWIYRRQR